MCKLYLPGIVFLLLLASCAHVPTNPLTRASILGAWYGNAHDANSGETGDNISVRNGDGTFVTYFRMCDDQGELSTLLESGNWEFSDGILTTRTLKVDGTDSMDALRDYYLEHYRVAALSDGRLRLTSLRTDVPIPPPDFIDARINGSAFQLPVEPCNATTRPAPN